MSKCLKTVLLVATCVAVGLQVIASDEYAVMLSYLEKIGESYLDESERGKLLSDFQQHWKGAEFLFCSDIAVWRYKMDLADANYQKIASNTSTIRCNKSQIDQLNNLQREEFEERDAYSTRKSLAIQKIRDLMRTNEMLSVENKNLKEKADEFRNQARPKMSFCYDKNFSIKLSKWHNECELGTFDIDKRIFPCRVCDGIIEDSQWCQNGVYVQRRIIPDTQDIFIGPFHSIEDAKSFKNDFNAGKIDVNITYDLKVSVRSGSKSVETEPGQRKLKWGAAAATVLYAALALGGETNVRPPNDSWFDEIGPVYKDFPAYFLECKLTSVETNVVCNLIEGEKGERKTPVVE